MVSQSQTRAALSPGNGHIARCRGDWVGPRVCLYCAEYLAAIGIRSPDPTAVEIYYAGYAVAAAVNQIYMVGVEVSRSFCLKDVLMKTWHT